MRSPLWMASGAAISYVSATAATLSGIAVSDGNLTDAAQGRAAEITAIAAEGAKNLRTDFRYSLTSTSWTTQDLLS